jgi:hypothetical protein
MVIWSGWIRLIARTFDTNSKLIENSAQLKALFAKGGIAQLGERLHGMQEVSGSIPLTSTKVYRIVKLK